MLNRLLQSETCDQTMIEEANKTMKLDRTIMVKDEIKEMPEEEEQKEEKPK